MAKKIVSKIVNAEIAKITIPNFKLAETMQSERDAANAIRSRVQKSQALQSLHSSETSFFKTLLDKILGPFNGTIGNIIQLQQKSTLAINKTPYTISSSSKEVDHIDEGPQAVKIKVEAHDIKLTQAPETLNASMPISINLKVAADKSIDCIQIQDKSTPTPSFKGKPKPTLKPFKASYWTKADFVSIENPNGSKSTLDSDGDYNPPEIATTEVISETSSGSRRRHSKGEEKSFQADPNDADLNSVEALNAAY